MKTHFFLSEALGIDETNLMKIEDTNYIHFTSDQTNNLYTHT